MLCKEDVIPARKFSEEQVVWLLRLNLQSELVVAVKEGDLTKRQQTYT